MVRRTNRPDLSSMLGSIGSVKKIKEVVVEKEDDSGEEDKVKRSYVITDTQLEMLMKLRAKIYRRSMNLSEIVGHAIEMLYKSKFPPKS
jgi:hypothetical protein